MTNTSDQPSASRWFRFRSSVARHPVITVVASVVGVAALVLSELVGLAPPITVVLLVIVGVVAVAVHRRITRRGSVGASGPVVAALAVAVVVVGVVIQLVPFGRAHANGPITGEPAWADSTTRDLMVRACYDCHSNEAEFPAYASVAPISWAVELHVNDGRGAVNYSTFATDPGDADDSVRVILDGSMPPAYFTRFGLHPEADLTATERDALIAGLRATPGLSRDGD